MPDSQFIKTIAFMMAAGIALSWWRYRSARDIAEQWLNQNRYRVRKLKMGWHILPRFSGTFGRNYKHAQEFRAEVDDMRLGGTGVVWLRVYANWMGVMQQEPEVSWERMPTEMDDSSRTTQDKWSDMQIALLERIANGESSFRSRSRNADDTEAFDEIVEHVMALQRRGLISADAPKLNLSGTAQFDSVTNAELTLAGQQLLDTQERERIEREEAARRARRSQA